MMKFTSNSRFTPGQPTHWHTLDAQTAFRTLESHPDYGLDHAQVQERIATFGLNKLKEKARPSNARIFLDQFTNIMILMLIVVAGLSALLGQEKDAIAILSIVSINGWLGYVQESRAEKTLASLKEMIVPMAWVKRQGEVQEIPGQDLVPGDIVLLEAGQQIPADGRLLEAVNMRIREAALTGEAKPVSKNAQAVLEVNVPLGDRINVAFQGTEVLRGRGILLVTATGMNTELGRVAAMLQRVESRLTPLQRRMNLLANSLVIGALILVVIVVLAPTTRTPDGQIVDGWTQLLTGNFAPLQQPLQVALSVVVAVVPEGLPTVITITLALGTQHMMRRNVLIRRLSAVETLGSITTICSDKTGTLTQNKMVAQVIHTPSTTYNITGHGYEPKGELVPVNQEQAESLKADLELSALLLAGTACNDATLRSEPGNIWTITGDSIEGALLTLAGKAQIDKSDVEQAFPRFGEFSFSSERKRMSVICSIAHHAWQDQNQRPNQPFISLPSCLRSTPYLMFTKGSPELVLSRCTSVLVKHQIEPLLAQERSQILWQTEQFAHQGMWVMGFAIRSLDVLPSIDEAEAIEQNLIWLGLVGMLDAPRPEARSAVALCRQAGIRPLMVTGDHQFTAMAIATNLGIASADDQALNGRDLDRLSQAELEAVVSNVSVYARVAPEHKLRIVQALQQNGEIVAMTGDGVNDAPAMKQADIGIAMGITGTGVSKEASDMVLLDDNFATIVAATEEGRLVYTNIRRFIKYVLGSNIGEVLTIAAVPILFVGEGVPLTPLQILWINLVTDGIPALGLAAEPAEPNVMRHPPFNPQESIFDRGLGNYIIRTGIIMAFITITMVLTVFPFRQEFGSDPEAWKTMVFTTLCLAQMGHAVAVCSQTQLTIEMNPFTNVYVWVAVIVTTLLQIGLIYSEPLRSFFDIHWLSPLQLAICVGFSALVFVWLEGEKLYLRFFQTHRVR